MHRDDAPPWADDPIAYLTKLGEGPESGFDPGAAALAFAARERPKTPLGRYLAHFDQLAQQVGEATADQASAEQRAEALAGVIHGAFGYAGDSLTYDDLQNADMVRVIDRRKGLPVALGILHLAVARRLDWPLVGLAFPGHFLLMLEHRGQRLPLDPFDGGAVLSAADMRRILKTVHGEQAELTADCYEPVSDRAVLLRLQNNIKLRRLKIGDIPGALRVAEAMFAFAPGTPELAREIAMMHTRLENITEAIRHFELYLAAEPNDALRHKAAALLQDLKNRLN
ncbi:MAG: transglutaminase-like domain-containing protein [Alphaproteobacteria bacterium]